MDSFNELQQLWQGADIKPGIPASALIRKFRRQRRKMISGYILTILALIASLGVMIWVFIDYDPALPTTRISIILIMTAVIGAILIKSKALQLLSGRIREDVSNLSMIADMQRLQRAQHLFSTTGLSVYFAMLSLGMALYLAEFASRGSMLFGITAYSLTFGWIAFAWFYLRKRGIARQQAKLNEMMNHLKALQQEWEESGTQP